MIKVISSIDIQPLLDEYSRLEPDIQWTGEHKKQAGLQFKDPSNPWDSGAGQSKGNKLAHTNLNPFFKDTVFEKVINEFKLIRTRLMWISPMTCYSMHNDTTPRVHIPMITNRNCYFVFKQGIIEHLAAGSVYWVDTRKTHTFINCSESPRLHLVGIVEQ